jgi:hypothetical protein
MIVLYLALEHLIKFGGKLIQKRFESDSYRIHNIVCNCSCTQVSTTLHQ